MKLERARELYSDYAEGTLTPAMKLALEQHLEADASARADYDEFARIFAVLGDRAPVDLDVPLGFRAKVMEMATAEQARRASAPRSLGDALREWFAPSGRRRLSGGVLAGAAALVVTGIAFSPLAGRHQISQGNVYGIPTPTSDATPLTIQSVSTADGADGNFYHYFHIHLPQAVQNATVNAYVITDSDQITDPAVRASDAHPALSAPLTLTNEEEMQIPVALAKRPPAGATLDMLVQWSSNNDPTRSGSQVVFTPFDVTDGGPAAPPTSNGNFYDMLRGVASVYHVTVIADASSAPTQIAKVWTTGDDVSTALNTVAGSVFYSVKKVNDTTYQVYKR